MDKGKGKTTYVRKNMKSHKKTTIYTFMDDDIDGTDYQVRDIVEIRRIALEGARRVNDIAKTTGESKYIVRLNI
jgi:hypothetical protein